MADNQLRDLLNNMDHVLNTKTVVGDPIMVDDATIVPLIEVSFGMASGSFGDNSKEKSAGGMGAKLSPVALLVVRNGSTRLINVREQDAVSKAVDMIPDIVNKITGKGIPGELVEKAKKIADGSKPVRE